MKKFIFVLILVFAVSLSACAAENNTDPSANINLPETLKTQTGQGEVLDEAAPAVEETPVIEDNPNPVSTPVPSDFATTFNTEYEDALSARNQLVIGTLKLAEAGWPVTQEQSQILLPLWQAVLALESNPDSAPQELSAVQNQIIANMNQEQIQAIITMALTNQDLIDLYAELGIPINENPEGTAMGSGQGRGMGGGGGDPAARQATRAAAEALGTPVSEGGGQGQNNKNQLTEAIINYLAELNQ